MIAYVEEADSGFDEMRLEVERIDPVGPDRVFLPRAVDRSRERERHRARRADVGALETSRWKLIRWLGFTDRDEAIKAAGLSE